MASKSAAVKRALKFFIIACMVMAASAMSRLSLPALELPVQEVRKCWEPLRKIDGCVMSISKQLMGIKGFSSPCCKVINPISRNCWPKIFPFYQRIIPVVLKKACTAIVPLQRPRG
ncbi:unnamed protein product [Fraxinus pennsylvanica]|uniref:Prolamin-like domain-containing protein n=1 Tax=Fraxinus pennsylvanica TaxID=56036 RepID=A0AAD2E582_9LAMI|nr:unnamed protein product [Fraxinus pennsylvanica]